MLTIRTQVSPASWISPDNFSSMISQEVHYYCRWVSCFCTTINTFIKVMNGPFPQPSTVKTNSQHPLIQISQCRHGSTTTRQCEGYRELPTGEFWLTLPSTLMGISCEMNDVLYLNSSQLIQLHSFFKCKRGMNFLSISSLSVKSHLRGNFKLNLNWWVQ